MIQQQLQVSAPQAAALPGLVRRLWRRIAFVCDLEIETTCDVAVCCPEKCATWNETASSNESATCVWISKASAIVFPVYPIASGIASGTRGGLYSKENDASILMQIWKRMTLRLAASKRNESALQMLTGLTGVTLWKLQLGSQIQLYS